MAHTSLLANIFVMKYFISCIDLEKQIGAMQIEADEGEYQRLAEKICPQRAIFRAYEIQEFEDDMPIEEFVSAEKMKELGY